MIEIIDSLAWPAVTLTIVLLLRTEIRELALRVTHLKHKDTELRFRETVGELQTQVLRSPRASRLTAQSIDPLVEIAAVSPRAAVMEAWAEIERAAVRAVQRLGVSATAEKPTPTKLIRSLARDHLSPQQTHALNEMRQLRNDATQLGESELGTDLAIDYIQLARESVLELDGLGAE